MKQKALCVERYKKKSDEERGHMSDLDLEREQECGICMETNNKIALPDCNHAMCIKCYREWYVLFSKRCRLDAFWSMFSAHQKTLQPVIDIWLPPFMQACTGPIMPILPGQSEACELP